MRYLPDNQIGHLIRNRCNAWLGRHPLKWRYGKKRFILEVRSLMNLIGNRQSFARSGTEYDLLRATRLPINRVLDIGANSGNLLFWLLDNDLVDRSVYYHGIEPDPDTFDQLRRNTTVHNGKLCNVNLNRAAAVVDGRISVEFQRSTVNNNSGMIRRLEMPGQWTAITVPALNLHSLSMDYDLVSIDIEGGEYELLEGALPRCIETARYLTVEWHDPLSDLRFIRRALSCSHRFLGYVGNHEIGNALFQRRG